MRIGVLGAGQLGRMLALAGYPLGHTFRFFDPAVDACAGQVAELISADYENLDALKIFATDIDVITYEFENVPLETIRYLEQFAPVYPPIFALEVSQHRLVEKTFFRNFGVATPDFVEAKDNTRFPAVLKTCRMGYDGKGQSIVYNQNEHEKALNAFGPQEVIAEQLIHFDRELSIIALRAQSGEMAFYPLVENTHAQGILRKSLAPAPRVIDALQNEAEEIATKVCKALNYVGVLAIEFFEVSGRLLVNEMAPRVHNSGHWTIEGAVTSQFENHVRAVAGLPLGSTKMLGQAGMINLIGEIPDETSILNIAGAHLHAYGKAPRTGRKVGHVTVVEQTAENLQQKLDLIKGMYE